MRSDKIEMECADLATPSNKLNAELNAPNFLRNAKIVVNLDEEKLIGKQNRLFDQE
jgi:hypothetical protein